MKNRTHTGWLLLGILALGLIGWSCRGRDDVTWDGEIYTSIDNSFAESEFASIRNMFDLEARADTQIYGRVSGTQGFYCPSAIVTVNVTGPGTARMTIDFGTGANCADGRLRTGKLHGDFSGKWKDENASVVITPEGYTSGGYSMTFTKTITVNPKVNGLWNWTVLVENAILSHPQNGAIAWEGTYTTTWVEGAGDLDPTNDVFEVDGNASGIARNNRAFTAVTAEPLRVPITCQWVTQGILELTPENLTMRSIDYGTGNCDNQAVLTVGAYVGNLTLP